MQQTGAKLTERSLSLSRAHVLIASKEKMKMGFTIGQRAGGGEKRPSNNSGAYHL